MFYILLKTLITALVVVGISETAKRSSEFAAMIAAIPFTSFLAFIWLYIDTGETEKIIKLSYSIFWLVIPTLLFFILFPLLLKYYRSFWTSLGASSLITILFYLLYIFICRRFGVNI